MSKYLRNPSIFEQVVITDLNKSLVPKELQGPTPAIRFPGDTSAPEWDPLQRPYKEWTRHIVASLLKDKPQKKNLLVMPSTTGRDIEVMKHYQISAPKSTWVCVERDGKVADYFKTNAERHKLFSASEQVIYHTDFLHTLPARGINEPFDFAWFDLYGNITWQDLNYFLHYYRFDDELLPNTDLFFTFAARGAWRGGNYFGTSTSLVKLIINTLLDRDRLAPKFQIEENIQQEYQKLISDQSVDARKAITRSSALDDVILTHIQLFKYIFSSYRGVDFDCNAFIYQDANHHEMVLYHLTNFKRVPNVADYFGKEPIDVIINLYHSKNLDDVRLAEKINTYIEEKTDLEIKLTSADVSYWRNLNKLSMPGKSEQFDFGAELEENLYNTLDNWPETFAGWEVNNLTPEQQIARAIEPLQELLIQRLAEFMPLKNHPDVKLSKQKYGLRLETPTCQKFSKAYYQIDFGTQTIVHHEQHIQIIPRFLHGDNLTGLHALFRIIFMGDPYLHPQLSYKIDPSTFQFTDPQETAIAKWRDSWNAREKGGLVSLPTGMGKTTVAVEIARMVLVKNLELYGEPIRPAKSKSPRILFLAGQAEILDQAVKSFLRPQAGPSFIKKDDIGIFYAETYNPEIKEMQERKGGWDSDEGKLNNLLSKLVFASVDSLRKHINLLENDPDVFTMIIVDEAHHTAAATWMEIIKGIEDGCEYMLGLTATPFRMDLKSVTDIYGDTLYEIDLQRGVYLGYLVWSEYFLYKDETRYISGKSKKAQIDEDDYRREIMGQFVAHAKNLKTVGFCRTKKEAIDWAEAFNTQLKIRSEALHEQTSVKARKKILEDFKAGTVQVLFVKDLFNEGVDVPDIEAVLFLRKTESAIKQLQQLGRGLRLAPGKRKLTVLDFFSNYSTIRALLETMSLLGFNFGMTGGGTSILDEGGVVPQITPTLPKVKFNLGEKEELYLRNQYDKEVEQNLQAYIYQQRQRNARLKEIILDEKTRGTNIGTVERMIKKADADIGREAPAVLQKKKAFIILFETVEYLFNNYEKEIAFNIVKKANVTQEQFDLVWECLTNKVSKADCVDHIMEILEKKRRRK